MEILINKLKKIDNFESITEEEIDENVVETVFKNNLMTLTVAIDNSMPLQDVIEGNFNDVTYKEEIRIDFKFKHFLIDNKYTSQEEMITRLKSETIQDSSKRNEEYYREFLFNEINNVYKMYKDKEKEVSSNYQKILYDDWTVNIEKLFQKNNIEIMDINVNDYENSLLYSNIYKSWSFVKDDIFTTYLLNIDGNLSAYKENLKTDTSKDYEIGLYSPENLEKVVEVLSVVI